MMDLHIHSIFSDGTDEPDRIAALAKQADLSLLSLTDHDTVEGITYAYSAAKSLDLGFIPGIELSTNVEGREYHILGYGPLNPSHAFFDTMAYLADNRRSRNLKIIENLNTAGIPLTITEVQQQTRGQVGRLHFARALIAGGYSKDLRSAFLTYLGEQGSAYSPRDCFTPIDAIMFLRAHGYIPVLAHPHLYPLSPEELMTLCKSLTCEGLGGMEVYYPEHGHERVSLYSQIAQALGLCMTGGSDYHGTHMPSRNLGRAYGGERMRDTHLNEISELIL